MSRGNGIAYDVVMAFLSLSLIVLSVVLFLICKKKPVQSEETLAVRLPAQAFSLTEVHGASDGFSSHRIIGEGRMGTVYAGVLSTGELVAIKRIRPHFVLSNAGFGFLAKIKSLSLAQHPNIVPVVGFCQAPGERVIVTEYAGMLSLGFYLHQNPDGAALLDWRKRMRIATGAARGIEYLHDIMAPSIVHGCVKASNVLIDFAFRARVCDYGLSFLAPNEKRGVVGFVDDEYWVERERACKESDVYGFGVVLLEILSGRSCEEGLLVKWALPLIKERRYGELLDPRLGLPSDLSPLVRMAKVALACVGNSRNNRPNIAQVAAILNSLEMEACI